MSINDGGSAFPVDEDFRDDGISRTRRRGGMSLRDYFAAKAMAAYVAKEGPASDEDGDFVAKYAYEIADAMLDERKAPAAVDPHSKRHTRPPTRRRRQ